MKPPVEIPIELPHEGCELEPLTPVPAGPCQTDAAFGEPGLSHAPQVTEVAPSCARMWPFDHC